jgi:hypothetical protein
MGTGIFVGIAARAADEMENGGNLDITPYWRTLKEGGRLNEKYPGGVDAQVARLEKEGFTIDAGRGKQPPRVRNFEEYLVEV